MCKLFLYRYIYTVYMSYTTCEIYLSISYYMYIYTYLCMYICLFMYIYIYMNPIKAMPPDWVIPLRIFGDGAESYSTLSLFCSPSCPSCSCTIVMVGDEFIDIRKTQIRDPHVDPASMQKCKHHGQQDLAPWLQRPKSLDVKCVKMVGRNITPAFNWVIKGFNHPRWCVRFLPSIIDAWC